MPAENFADAPPNLAVAVLGDVMLDDNVMLGDATRQFDLTTRAKLLGRSSGLGGAGNVAANAAGLGLATALVGMVGDDAHGGRLHGLARAKAGLAQMLFVCDGLTTPRKLRLYGPHGLTTLIDDEGPPASYYATGRSRRPLLPTPEAVCRHLADAGVRVFCEVDHGKGFLLDDDSDAFPASSLRRAVRETGVPVIADPRPCRNWPYIPGDRVVLKMNHDQLNDVVGVPLGREFVIPGYHVFPEAEQRTHFALVRDAVRASRVIHCDYLWLTYGGAGMSIGPMDGGWSAHLQAHHGNAVPIEDLRSDATGCGDTCTAVMAHAIATRGYTAAAVVDGFLYANRAAGLAARHLGCHVLTKKTFEEVQRGVAEAEDRIRVLANVA